MTARILVTGSRSWTNVSRMRSIIRDVLDEYGTDVTLVHGNARGADRLAAQIAECWGAKTEPHAADWDGPCRKTCRPGHRRPRGNGDFCPAAGDYRNQDMVDLGADLLLAFLVPPSVSACKGTRDCLRRAKAARISYRVYESGGAA